MNSSQLKQEKSHLLTVLLEDYFHVGAFNGLIEREKWYRFEPRFERNTLKALDLLDRFEIKATFYVLGWIADKQPELVREISRRGHEIASRGYFHRSIRHMSASEFRDDLRKTRDLLEDTSNQRIVGFRAARRLYLPEDAWALDVLAQESYIHDSSVRPTARSLAANRDHQFAYKHKYNGNELWEFPLATSSLFGWPFPILGGNYSRQFPHTVIKHVMRNWDRRYDAPFVLYFHVWELDPDQPRINGASPLARLRHYRKLDKMSWLLEEYFKTYRFSGLANFLGTEIKSSQKTVAAVVAERPTTTVSASDQSIQPAFLDQREKSPVTIVVPCYNEELTLAYLFNTLKSVEETLAVNYAPRFIFVDDCSTDGTARVLNQLFAAKTNCRIIRHDQNKGVAGAVVTGIREAETEIVCSIDCDCTYDPHELQEMIPKLDEGVDLVTASPYHPLGLVRNVPGWRLALSKISSWLYRHVLRQKLFTYTSCFRVYRKSAMERLDLKETGFLGIAEIVGLLDFRGTKIVEHPATLEVRLFGYSKMKTLKTITGHLKLLSRFAYQRAGGGDVRQTTIPQAKSATHP